MHSARGIFTVRLSIHVGDVAQCGMSAADRLTPPTTWCTCGDGFSPGLTRLEMQKYGKHHSLIRDWADERGRETPLVVVTLTGQAAR